MRASVNENADIILTLTDRSAEPGFVGYELSRKTDASDWADWTGSAWQIGGSAAALASPRFSDYSLASGLYQYRSRVRYETSPGVFSFSEYEESDWLRIASATSERHGWTFGNYAPPPDEFGAVLTPDDMRHTYLWGVPFTSSNGEEYTDPQIQATIDSSVAEIERALNLSILKRVIKCQKDYVEGPYDVLEDPYAYHRHDWNAGGRLALRRRPILSVERFALYTITQQRVMDLMPWLSVDHEKGILHFYPRAGNNNEMRVSPTFLVYGYPMAGPNYHHGYRVDYTAGYADAGKVPADLRDIIGKVAACKLLNIIGDGLIAGFASMSLGLDGLSESFSTTQSATNAFYGARIGVYLKDIEKYLKENRRKFRGAVMGSI